jgi:ATP-dependent Lhr-like helicase
VEGLGAAQFAMDGAVDRLRAVSNARERGEALPSPGPGYGFTAEGLPNGFYGSAQQNDFPDPAQANGFYDPAQQNGLTEPDAPNRLTSRSGTASDGAPHGRTPPGAFDGADGDGFAHPRLDDDFTWPPTNHPTNPAPGEYVSPRDLADPFASPGYGGPRGGGATGYHQAANRSYGNGRAASPDPRAVVLAAADPANAYGAALPWPEPPTGAGHKPGRKAGSLVVLVAGELTLYMERGGKTLLAWPASPDTAADDDPRLRTAAEALATAVRAGSLGTVTVERINGAQALTSPIGALLEAAGFVATPRGLRLRA